MDPIDYEVRAAGGANNRQPWLKTFVDLPGARRRLNGRVEVLLTDPEKSRGRSLVVRRLKPHLGSREMVLPEAEAQIAMREASRSLVRAIEEGREPISRGNTVRWDGAAQNWSLADHRKPHREYRIDRKSIVASSDFIATTDVRAFFPSLDIGLLRRALSEDLGVMPSEITTPLRLISAHNTAERRLAVGPELSSVLGNAALTRADRVLINLLGHDAVIRWVDDINFGAQSEAHGWEVLEEFAQEGLAPLGVVRHPLKTEVVPSHAWTARDPSYVDSDGDLSPETPELVPRNAVRDKLDTLTARRTDPEHAALAVARRLGTMLSDHRAAVRTIAGLAPESTQVGDAAVDAVTARAAMPYSDSAAEALLDLLDHGVEIGQRGRERLLATAADQHLPSRTRGVSAWVLAKAGSFDRGLLGGLDEMHRHGARAILSAAALAGHSPTSTAVARALN